MHYNSINKIIFCENTGFVYDYAFLFELAKKYGKNLEVITFQGNYQLITKQGKGYGEGEIIKYVLDNSKLFIGSVCFVKLTGRLIVENFDKIIRSSKDDLNYFFLPSLFRLKKDRFLPSVFYKVNTQFFLNYMKDAYLDVNDSNNYKLEHAYFMKVYQHSPRYFKYYPYISGQSGSNGTF